MFKGATLCSLQAALCNFVKKYNTSELIIVKIKIYNKLFRLDVRKCDIKWRTAGGVFGLLPLNH